MPTALPAPERVLVVDDDPGVTSVLRRALTRSGYAVRTATDGDEALRAACEFRPDLVVLDILMPGIDGLEVCRRLRRVDEDVAILMLTAKDRARDQVIGLDAGADDYLVKPFSLQVLAAHVRALLRRREVPQTELLRCADLELDTGPRVARRGGREIHLTTTEYRLLEEFVRHPGQVLSKEHLTQRVWGYDFEGNLNVVEVYVGYLRDKLEAGGMRRLLHTLRGAGYVLRESAP
ncbi:MAG: response regulator transcription factor [Chloroflexi bacterium]|nr:response regulator transcription factor [Chloroflexota bacterium]